MSLDLDTFIYDGDCGICTTSVAWLSERCEGGVEFVPATRELLASAGVSPADAQQAVILLTAEGARFDGSLAFGEVLRRSTKYDRNLLGRLLLEQPSRQVAGWVYSWVAKNRHRLSHGGGGVCGIPRQALQPAKEKHDEESQ